MRAQPDAVLAHLVDVLNRHLGEQRAERGPTPTERMATFFDRPVRELSSVHTELGAVRELCVAWTLDELAHHHPEATLHSASAYEETPSRRHVDLGDVERFLPSSCLVTWPAGTLDAEVPLATLKSMAPTPSAEPSQVLRVVGPPEAPEAARRALQQLRDHADGPGNVLRGRVLHIREDRGLLLDPVATPSATREQLVLPDAVWEAVQRNVASAFARREALAAAGLWSSRGLLLQGPAGTGKSTLARTLAGEVAGTATVIVAEATSIVRRVHELYRELTTLTPALVVIEDLDLLVGNRSGRPDRSAALQTLLSALDHAHRTYEGVVTLATTNEPGGLDASVTRAGRFEETVTLAAPDQRSRAAILARYLAPLGLDEPALLTRLAHLTPGATGADLARLCRTAILAAEGAPGAEDLLAAARPDDEPANLGTYL